MRDAGNEKKNTARLASQTKAAHSPLWTGSLGQIHSETHEGSRRLCLYYILNKIEE